MVHVTKGTKGFQTHFYISQLEAYKYNICMYVGILQHPSASFRQTLTTLRILYENIVVMRPHEMKDIALRTYRQTSVQTEQ